MTVIPPNQTLLTGDRATGALGLGHYVRSLRHRLAYQEKHQQFLLLSDGTDSDEGAAQEIALDYLAIGIDPQRSTIAVRSHMPELAELAACYARLGSEVLAGDDQIAHHIPEITALQARLIPTASPAQAALVQRGNALVQHINQRAGSQILVTAAPVMAANARNTTALNSVAHQLPLSATPDQISAAIHALATDPGRASRFAPGDVEHNEVFFFMDAFETDIHFLDDLKSKYRRGGLSDVVIKHHLEDCVQRFLEPVRERRQQLAQDLASVQRVLQEGTQRARRIAAQTLADVKAAL
ncbi:tryptophan--tRNA ligase [Silvimonas sp. JCM 19000]